MSARRRDHRPPTQGPSSDQIRLHPFGLASRRRPPSSSRVRSGSSVDSPVQTDIPHTLTEPHFRLTGAGTPRGSMGWPRAPPEGQIGAQCWWGGGRGGGGLESRRQGRKRRAGLLRGGGGASPDLSALASHLARPRLPSTPGQSPAGSGDQGSTQDRSRDPPRWQSGLQGGPLAKGSPGPESSAGRGAAAAEGVTCTQRRD